MATTAARAESRWNERADDTLRRAAAVRMAVEAVVPRGPVALPDAQTLVVVCAPAATAADAAPPTCPESSDAPASTAAEALARHRRVEPAPECVPLQAWRVWLLPREAPAVARCAAASPADALPARAGARVAVFARALRCEAGSSVERIVQRVPMAAQQTRLQRWAWEALRLSPRQPVVLRFGAARERSRLEVLHR
jgi:hypothetical protein